MNGTFGVGKIRRGPLEPLSIEFNPLGYWASDFISSNHNSTFKNETALCQPSESVGTRTGRFEVGAKRSLLEPAPQCLPQQTGLPGWLLGPP